MRRFQLTNHSLLKSKNGACFFHHYIECKLFFELSKITLEINGKTKTSGLDFRYLVADAIIDLTEITERVYYNSNILTYEFSEAALLNNLSLNIYSSTGQLVMTKDISESSDKTIQIDVSELPSGVYISDLKGSSFKFSK
mgnify:CR=1 FL=1